MFNWLKKFFGRRSVGKTAYPGVVVARITALRPHPNADKLQLVEVDNGSDKLSVVCGAWNIKVGDKAPLAAVGAKLPNGLEIKEAVIRGQRSAGMLCAADELGRGRDHSGILLLSEDAKVGEAIDRYL